MPDSPTSTSSSPPPPADRDLDFPEIAWSSRLFRCYRDLIAPTTEAPLEFIWGSMLAGLSFVAAGDCWLEWGTTRLRPTPFVALIGETAKGRKSTSLNDMLDVIVRPVLERKQPIGNEPAAFEVVTGMGSGEGFMEAIADRAWKGDDGVERTQTGRRVMVVVHEIGELLAKIARGQAGSLLDFFLNGFEPPREFSMRTRGQAVKATDPAIVVLGASTAEWFVENLQPALVMNGFLNRFLVLRGHRRQALPLRPAIDQHRLREFQHDLNAALDAVHGRELTFSDAARKLYAARYNEDYAREPQGELIDAASARTDALALRIAALLAIGDATTIISESHVEAAWAVAAYSGRTANDLVLRIDARTMKEAEGRILEHAKRAAERAIGAGGEAVFTRRDVFQRVKGKSGLSAETFDRCWRALLGAEEIVPVDDRLFRVNQ